MKPARRSRANARTFPIATSPPEGIARCGPTSGNPLPPNPSPTRPKWSVDNGAKARASRAIAAAIDASP
jgi:hypothetical protein